MASVPTAAFAIFEEVIAPSKIIDEDTNASPKCSARKLPGAKFCAVKLRSATLLAVIAPFAIFAPVTTPSANLDVKTAPSANFEDVTAPSTRLTVLTEKVASLLAVIAPSAICCG